MWKGAWVYFPPVLFYLSFPMMGGGGGAQNALNTDAALLLSERQSDEQHHDCERIRRDCDWRRDLRLVSSK